MHPAPPDAMTGIVSKSARVDPQYFIDKYNVPITRQKNNVTSCGTCIDDSEQAAKKKKDKEKQKLVKPFFD